VNDPLVRYAPWPSEFEVRSNPDTGGLRWSGYAAVFNTPSLPLRFAGVNRGRPFVEVIQPGAFTRTLNASPDISLLWQHDLQGVVLGRTSAGTLTLAEDEHGLRAEGDLPDNAWGRPIADALTRGDVRGMSYRMGPQVKDNAQPDGTYPLEALGDGSRYGVRRMREIRLEAEVSFTHRPATPATSAGMRALPDAVTEAIAVLDDPDGRLTRDQLALLAEYLPTRASPSCCPACDAEDASCCARSSSKCPSACSGADCTLGCKCIGDDEGDNDGDLPGSLDAPDQKSAPTGATTVRKDALRARLAALRSGE
jgi:HK97 family phage prohead protease